jgi:hypothetical protein
MTVTSYLQHIASNTSSHTKALRESCHKRLGWGKIKVLGFERAMSSGRRQDIAGEAVGVDWDEGIDIGAK